MLYAYSYISLHYNAGVALLKKYYYEFLKNLSADIFITLEIFYDFNIDYGDKAFSIFLSCSSSQECNKKILHFLIESTKNDNQLLCFSFMIQAVTGESNVATLFREG